MAKGTRKSKAVTNMQIAEDLTEGGDEQQASEAAAAQPVLENLFTLNEARIKKEIFLAVKYHEASVKNTDEVKRDCGAVIHDDLIAAFAKLDEHWCRASEQYNESGNFDFAHCSCSGFSLSGDGVTLFGSRELDVLSFVAFPSPTISWAGAYEFVSELGEAIEDCKHEVKEYLFNGKHKPPVVKPADAGEQKPSLPFDNENEDYSEPEL